MTRSDKLLSLEQLRSLETEAEFQTRVVTVARLAGWKVYAIPDSRRATIAGYPDLTMWRGTRLIFAELKRDKGRLSPAQVEVLDDLRKIPCAEVYVWRPNEWTDIRKALQ